MVVAIPNTTMSRARPLSFMPPFLKVEKKLGPTCRPTVKMNSISPKFFRKFTISSLTAMLKEPTSSPTNSTKVAPNDTPLIFTLPNSIPKAMMTL